MQRVEVVSWQVITRAHLAPKQLHAQDGINEAEQHQQRRDVAVENPMRVRSRYDTASTISGAYPNDDNDRATTRKIIRMLSKYRTKRTMRKMRAERKAVNPLPAPTNRST